MIQFLRQARPGGCLVALAAGMLGIVGTAPARPAPPDTPAERQAEVIAESDGKRPSRLPIATSAPHRGPAAARPKLMSPYHPAASSPEAATPPRPLTAFSPPVPPRPPVAAPAPEPRVPVAVSQPRPEMPRPARRGLLPRLRGLFSRGIPGIVPANSVMPVPAMPHITAPANWVNAPPGTSWTGRAPAEAAPPPLPSQVEDDATSLPEGEDAFRSPPGAVGIDEVRPTSGLSPVALGPTAEQLRQKVLAACAGAVRDVQAVAQPDGTILVTVKLPSVEAESAIVRKVLQLPEMSAPHVRLQLEVAP